MSKYFFDEMDIERELIILLGIVSASKYNHLLLDAISREGLLLPIHYAEGYIIQEKLISSAIKLRMIDDVFKNTHNTPRLPFSTVGTLTTTAAREDGLKLREACNKIIHAKKYLPQNEPTDEHENYQFYVPTIILEGDINGSGWSVILDLEKYVCNGLSLLKYYDEDWELKSR